MNPLQQRSLAGRRIAVTQRADLARPLLDALRLRGAEVLAVPATRWLPHPDRQKLEKALAALGSYDWILFSNPQGIDIFFDRFFETHRDVSELGPAKLGAYGPMTGAALRERGLRPTAVAPDHKTPLILRAITDCGSVCGQKFLILRGELATERVPEALAELGALVEAVPCYAVEPERGDPTGDAAKLVERGAEWIVFASGLAIEHFHARFDLPKLVARFPRLRLAIASETINWALQELGLVPAVISKPNDVEDLIGAIIQAESGQIT
jgi:uroporphyrinogen III methyltransferase / synthase